MRWPRFALTLASIVALAAFAWPVTLPAQVTGWHQWRGANRDGHSLETGLLQAWPPDGPSLAWSANGAGIGYSSLSAAHGRLYTLGNQDGSEFVVAFDASTGERLWTTAHGRRFNNEEGNGPRSTPTVIGDRLYVLGARGDLTCLEAATGLIVWSVNVPERFDSDRPHWGFSESPLVVGDRVLVNSGARDGAIVALNRHDGSVIWRSQSDRAGRAGYSSAVTQRIRGIETAVFFTQRRALGIVVEDGQLVWSYAGANNATANIATPIVHGTQVFLSSNYERGAALLEIGEGGADAHEVYFSRRMRNHHSSSVLVDDHVYGFNGSILTALRLSDGKVAWRDRSVGKGALIYADRRLYLFSERGVVGLAEATPEGYREMGRFRLDTGFARAWNHPIISNGHLILRHQDDIHAYDIRAR